MWLMLQQPTPDDYVVATGETHTVKRLVELAFQAAGLNWEKYVVTDPALVRPAEVDLLIGDPSKAKAKLGWVPTTTFEQLVREMTKSDYTAARRDSLVKLAGFQAYDYHE
jgi:GDPmannose 4,6-dehydratase